MRHGQRPSCTSAQQMERKGFLAIGAVRELLMLGSVIGFVLTGICQVNSAIRAHMAAQGLTLETEFADPILSLDYDRDHQSLMVHRWHENLEEISLVDDSNWAHEFPIDCISVESSETNSTSIILTQPAHKGRIRHEVRIFQDGEFVLSDEFEFSANSMADVRIAADGSVAMIVAHEGQVVGWDLTASTPMRWDCSLAIAASSSRLSPDGHRLFVVSNDGHSGILDSHTGQLHVAMPDIPACCRRIAWSNDNRRVAFGTQNGTLHVFDALSGQEIWHAKNNYLFPHVLALSADGSLLAVSGFEANIQIWNLAQPENPRTF